MSVEGTELVTDKCLVGVADFSDMPLDFADLASDRGTLFMMASSGVVRPSECLFAVSAGRELAGSVLDLG